VPHRIDPEQGTRLFYSLMIERDLFGQIRLVRAWGSIGANARELVEDYPSEDAAGQVVAEELRRRGYRDL
jgi:predicted DNA-binding WGR domain protein